MEKSRAKADELRRARRFEEAASEYATLWPDGDPWTGWGYAHCLRKIGRSAEAIAVAGEVCRLDPTFRLGRSAFAWALFDVHVRAAENPSPEALKAAETIVQLTASEEDFYSATSAFVPTVLRIAKAFSRSGKDVRALEWLNKFDPARLPDKPGKRSDEDGREKELASPKERYYSIRTRALQRLGRWEECQEAATRALAECGRLHHDNDVWFARRIAVAKLKLGHAEEARAELERLAARKPAGFMQTDIAAAAWEAGDAESTFKHALQALLASGDIGYKLDAARLLAEVLWQRGDHESARHHLALCLAVRQSKGWKCSEDLSARASEWGVHEIDSEPDSLIKKLRPLWRRWSEELSPRKVGTVQRILPHGRAGFIRAEPGEDFYFDVRDWHDRGSKPTEGTPVTFRMRSGYDKKRERSTTVAYDIRITNPLRQQEG